jgi:hypothetical protein
MPAAKTTTDHDEIRRWVEKRGGKPAAVKGTGGGEDPGIIRVMFPQFGDDSALEEISWEEFFRKFDENDLSFLYQETKASGEHSTFNKFVKRETASA